MLRIGLLVITAATLVSGCRRIVYRDIPCDATYGDPDAAPDARTDDARVPDAMIDAMIDAMFDGMPDAAPDAPPTCTTAGDLADHLEPIGGVGGTPQMAVDTFGAVAAVASIGGGQLTFLGATGQRRGSDVVLGFAPTAIVFDGIAYRLVEQAGGSVQVRTMAADGSLSVPTVLGVGRAVSGALAVHASGDVAVLWNATVDGSLRATVVTAAGTLVHTVLDTPTTFTNTQLLGGVIATQSATARFVVAYPKIEVGGNNTTVWARTLAPDGVATVISTGALEARHRVGAALGATTDTALITWRGDTSVHAVGFHPVTGIVVADRAVITTPAGSLTRVAGRGGPGTGFEILVDHAVTISDRALILHSFDAAGNPVGTPRRIATICTNAYSEENLSFVRNASVRYVTWHDMTLPDNITGAF